MPRITRPIVPDYPHHIIQRGHNRQVVFTSDEDYLFYLDNLREWKDKLGCRVYAYCMMTNHVHLIIDPGEKATNLSQLIKRLAAATDKICQQEGKTYRESLGRPLQIKPDQYKRISSGLLPVH